jgi:hypothetical protein
MKRAWKRRLAAPKARARDAFPVNRLLIPCIIRPDACSRPPNPCSFDDVSPDNFRVIREGALFGAADQAHCAGHSRRPHFPRFTSPIEIAGKQR